MPKKKHRKKARPSKRAAPRKAPKHTAHAKGSKRSKHRPAHVKAEGHSFSLLRAIKRRREAERGKHPEPHTIGGSGHHGRKARPNRHISKRSHHRAEPVVTEKSFENMLAFRRFQNHAR